MLQNRGMMQRVPDSLGRAAWALTPAAMLALKEQQQQPQGSGTRSRSSGPSISAAGPTGGAAGARTSEAGTGAAGSRPPAAPSGPATSTRVHAGQGLRGPQASSEAETSLVHHSAVQAGSAAPPTSSYHRSVAAGSTKVNRQLLTSAGSGELMVGGRGAAGGATIVLAAAQPAVPGVPSLSYYGLAPAGKENAVLSVHGGAPLALAVPSAHMASSAIVLASTKGLGSAAAVMAASKVAMHPAAFAAPAAAAVATVGGIAIEAVPAETHMLVPAMAGMEAAATEYIPVVRVARSHALDAHTGVMGADAQVVHARPAVANLPPTSMSRAMSDEEEAALALLGLGPFFPSPASKAGVPADEAGGADGHAMGMCRQAAAGEWSAQGQLVAGGAGGADDVRRNAPGCDVRFTSLSQVAYC